VNISEAMQIVSTPFTVPGRSDHGLLRSIGNASNYVAPSKTLVAVPSLDQGITMRPIDALHQLSFVTGPAYQNDIFDQYVQWGLHRYLGFFDRSYDAAGQVTLRLSAAGARIAGNQRRVTSEEMGIGFGAVLGRRWFTQTGGAGSGVTVIDIDAALGNRFVYAAGRRQAVRAVTSRRPDYLIIGRGAGNPRRYLVRALECKGTKSKGHAVRQLAGAVTQLEGVSVGGRIPRGLAVSTITANDDVSYLAVDPDDGELSFAVSSNSVEEYSNFVLRAESNDIPVGAVLRGSWAVLADFGGNMAALSRWAFPAMKDRRFRLQPDRPTIQTPFGSARGTRATFNIDGRQLTVWHAIAMTVDQQLANGSVEEIADAQAAFAQARARSDDQEASSQAVFSAAPDGSVFALILE
jgi:hypothetical protein